MILRLLLVLLCVLLLGAIAVAAPADAPAPAPADAPAEPRPPSRGFSGVSRVFGFGFLLQIAAFIHWAKKRPAPFWLWVILFGGFIGALAYFLIEGLPDLRGVGQSLKGPSRRKRIRELQAIVLDNQAAGNYEELGELLLMEKRWAEARAALDQALASRTDSIDPFYRRAIALYELGEAEAAVRDLEHVVATNPKYDYSNAYCLYGRALEKSGRNGEAMTVFERLAESSASETLFAAAQFFANHGRPDQARELATRIVTREATMPAYQRRRDRTWIRKARALLRANS